MRAGTCSQLWLLRQMQAHERFTDCCSMYLLSLSDIRNNDPPVCAMQWTPMAIILTAVVLCLVAVYLLVVLLSAAVEYIRL